MNDLRLRRSLACALLCLPMAACAESIDGSSPEAARVSIERIERDLDAAEREKLQDAIRMVVADALGHSLAFGSAVTGEHVDQQVRAFLDGKSAREVIEGAGALRASRNSARGTP